MVAKQNELSLLLEGLLKQLWSIQCLYHEQSIIYSWYKHSTLSESEVLWDTKCNTLSWCINSGWQKIPVLTSAIIFLIRCHGLPLSSVESNSPSVINYNYTVFIHAVNINHEALRIRISLLVKHKSSTHHNILYLINPWENEEGQLDSSVQVVLQKSEWFIQKQQNVYTYTYSMIKRKYTHTHTNNLFSV